jgi:hypothetical protein
VNPSRDRQELTLRGYWSSVSSPIINLMIKIFNNNLQLRRLSESETTKTTFVCCAMLEC